MECVWTNTANGARECRAVACGNGEQRDPSQQGWTAQAETSSDRGGLRMAQIRNWSNVSLGVNGAFMQAPLPEDKLVVVRPPASWVRRGLAGPEELWTGNVALYGLRESPRWRGLDRDNKLRGLQVDVG